MDVEDHRRRAYDVEPKVEASKEIKARAQNRYVIHAEEVTVIVHSAIREDLQRKIGHDHGVRHTKNVVGVGRAVEGEDADLRVASVGRRDDVQRSVYNERVDGVAPDGEFSRLDAIDA